MLRTGKIWEKYLYDKLYVREEGKMKRIKRCLSLILSLAMLFSVFPSMMVLGAEEKENNLAVAMSEGGSCRVVQGDGHADSAESFEIRLEEGKEATLKFTADDGYCIKIVSVNDEEQSLDPESTEYTYKYTPSSSPMAVNVVFSESVSNTDNSDKQKTDKPNTNKQDADKQAVDDKKDSVVVKDELELAEKVDDIQDTLRDATPEELAHPSKYVGEPGKDGYKFTLERPIESVSDGNISTCNVKTGSVTVEVPTNYPVYNYCPLGNGSNLKVSLKDVWDDYYNNKDFYWNNNQWCRMVYCLDWHKGSPSGGTYAANTAPLSKEINYCLTYGVQYWGHTAYSSYSSGDWIMDYCITQLAIHACNKEFGGDIDYTQDYISKHINNATVRTKFNELVNAAQGYPGNYDQFGNDGGNIVYNGFTYNVAPASQNRWSSYTYNGRAGYITSDYYSQNISANKWLTYSMPWYITDSGCTASGFNAEIVWEESKNYSRFRIWVPEASYREAQSTGGTVTATLTCQSPNGLCGWKYNPSGGKGQPFTFLEQYKMIGRSKSVSASIARVVQDGTLTISKVSANTSLVKDNKNYTLNNAKFDVYKTGTSTLVKTLTTDSNGWAQCTLAAGTYDVVEVTAPSGYIRDTSRHKVTITSGGSSNLSVSNNPIYGIIDLTKSSAKPEYTKGNDMYSLEGAVYGVYKQGTNTKICEIKTNKDGKGSSEKLPIGSYHVKEITAPKGYVLDKSIYSVNVSSSASSAEVRYPLAVTDKPYLDPITVILRKVDASTGKPTSAGKGTLGGAEFKVKYYPVSGYKIDPAEYGKTASRSWVFRTDKDGYINIRDKRYFVSGDELYTIDGTITFPVGTITVQEITAPNGYLLSDKVFVVPIELNSKEQRVTSYAIPTVPENSLDFRLSKYDDNTSGPISGAVFRHTSPDGSTEEATTDEYGRLSFKGLVWGSHTIEEISAPDGYVVNTNKITFDVAEDNTIKITSKVTETDTIGYINIEVADDGCIDATVYDKPMPYKIKVHKTNNKNFVLAGAEFTLYEDIKCTKELGKTVTDSKGELTFSDLIPRKEYWVKETKAPTGYHLPDQDIVFRINAYSMPSDEDEDYFGCYVSYGRAAYGPSMVPNSVSAGMSGNVLVHTGATGDFYITGDKKNGYTLNINVENQIGAKLPNTGSSATIVLVIVGVLLVLVGYIFDRKRKYVVR